MKLYVLHVYGTFKIT